MVLVRTPGKSRMKTGDLVVKSDSTFRSVVGCSTHERFDIVANMSWRDIGIVIDIKADVFDENARPNRENDQEVLVLVNGSIGWFSEKDIRILR